MKTEFAGIAFWTAFVLASRLLAKDYLYFFKGTAVYFFIILGGVLVYQLIRKWLIQKTKPSYLSINNDVIYLKNFFSKSKRKIETLKLVSYDTKQNAILLSFQEGLDNIKLYLTDYEINDIQSLINKIKQTKGDKIFIDENFKKYFVHNV
ncbi:MAG TPA: hypothetical protein VHB48_00685 [Chitinophagaceae bacterium]|nr:hypothetical protein [Chitinophagaceae bacterium]